MHNHDFIHCYTYNILVSSTASFIIVIILRTVQWRYQILIMEIYAKIHHYKKCYIIMTKIS